MRSVLRTRTVPLLLAALLVGCQAVFGDFDIVPVAEPVFELGTACQPGAVRCSEERLETCSDDRNGWVVAETCASAAECNLSSERCRPCVPGEHMCRGAALERCNDSLTWDLVEPCASAELCSVMPDRLSGRCTDPVCTTPGEHACDDGRLTRCAPGLHAIELVALCETPTLCDAARANELAGMGRRGACLPPACPAGGYRCDGATLSRCRFDRTDWQEVAVCDSPDLCNVGFGACMPCEPEQLGCNGAVLRRCSDDGTWQTVDTCDSAGLCDPVLGSCREAECDEPGRLTCGRDGFPALERCTNDFEWETVDVCVTGELCSVAAGRCLRPACAPEETRCRGAEHQLCSRDLTRWEALRTCAAGELCDVTLGCVPGPCDEGSLRCNGTSLERCAGGSYVQEDRCETAALCDAAAGMCHPPLCGGALDAFRCRTPDIIQSCAPGRDAWGSDFRTCTEGSLCDPVPALGTGLPECDVCTPNAFECQGNELLRCSADGQALVPVAMCPASCAVEAGEPVCE